MAVARESQRPQRAARERDRGSEPLAGTVSKRCDAESELQQPGPALLEAERQEMDVAGVQAYWFEAPYSLVNAQLCEGGYVAKGVEESSGLLGRSGERGHVMKQ